MLCCYGPLLQNSVGTPKWIVSKYKYPWTFNQLSGQAWEHNLTLKLLTTKKVLIFCPQQANYFYESDYLDGSTPTCPQEASVRANRLL